MPPYHVPSDTTISGLCPQNLPQDELQDAIQVSFRQKRQVFDAALCLLSLFAIPSFSKPEIMSKKCCLIHQDSWTLNTLTRFWEAISPDGAQIDYVDSSLSSVTSFLDRLHMFYTRTSGLLCSGQGHGIQSLLDSRSVVVKRVSLLCSQITTTFLVTEPLPLPNPVEKRLCLTVFDLALTDPKSGLRLQSFAGNTLSNLLEVRQDHKRFDAFGQDLQVRVSR